MTIKSAPIPLNETQRLAAVQSLDILDTPAEERFDRITRLAQRLLGVPIAQVNFIDSERQWSKSSQGITTGSIPRNSSVCAHTILEGAVLIVPDLLQDKRFAENPLIKNAQGLRFYAGQPLKSSDGNVVGTLCVMDRRLRQLSENDLAVLHDLAAIVEDELNFTQATRIQAHLESEIAQRQHAENEALKLAQVQKAVFDAADVILITSDVKGVITGFNATAEQKLGYTASEVIGKVTPGIFHDPLEMAQRAEMLSSELGETFKPGLVVVLAKALRDISNKDEWTHITKDGRRFPAILSVTPIYDAEREISGYIGVAVDISARKQAEQRLATSEARFRDIVSTMPGVIYQAIFDDAGWRISYISPSIMNIAGVSAEAIVTDLYALIRSFHPDDVAAFITTGDAARIAMQPWKFEGRLIKPSGELRWWQGTSVPHTTADGEIVFNGVMLDITDHKRAEVALQATQKRLIDAQDIARVGNWTWDVTTNEMSWGDLIFELFDVPRDTTPSFELLVSRLHPDDIAAVQQIIQTAFQSGAETYKAESRIVHPTGKILNGYMLCRIVRDAAGKPVEVIGTSQDVTEYRQAEKQIRLQNESLVKANRELAVARKQAEAASKLKSQFLATMSHELRTPLNAIIGYSQLQLAGMVGDMSQEQFNYQERILVNAQHLLKMINEVLDLSKIEAGRVELAVKPFNLRQCLDDVLNQSQVLADAKQLQVALTMDERLPDVLLGDLSRLKQIILNLLSNAIKFTESGSVRIAAQKLDEAHWQLVVSDTGIGIPSHMQETIFDEFRQVDDSSTRQQGGTGLGLAIVRRLVLMMGGGIRVVSDVGKGSSFTITLPTIVNSLALVEG